MDVRSLEERARPHMVNEAAYHYYAGGSDDELTLAENVAAWRRIRFLPHVMRDVSAIDTRTELLGTQLAAPILIAPMAAQKLAHPDGEVAMARAAADAGTVMVVSTMATVSLEEVAAAAEGAARWFQFYVHRDRGLSAELVMRAEAAGYGVVVLTVDVPVLANRRRDEIHRFDLPDGMTMANLEVSLASGGGSALAEYTNQTFEPALTPDDIGWVRSLVDLPVVVKGVLRPDDAVAAVEAGAAGVIVSNHGGRQLDGAIATANALPAVAEALGRRVPVLVDGGIRGGYDVVKAVGLGADAVLVGRPFLWGLAIDGATGATAVFDELTEELERTMALLGVTAIGEIGTDLIG